MNELPESWLWISGLFFGLGSLFMVIAVALALVTFRLLTDLNRQLQSLAERVERIARRVESLTETAQTVGTDVGVRATGIMRIVDDLAGTAHRRLERLAPWLLLAGAIYRIWARSRRD